MIEQANPNLQPVNAEDKRCVNGKTDINQLAPFRYPWAWDYFINANKNHWTPNDVNMTQDITDYRNLTPGEKHAYENTLAYLTTSDIMAMRNIGLAVMEKMTAPELQIYQARQVAEESIHTWAYQHCLETLGIDQQEMYNRYRVVPEINAKIQLTASYLDSITDPNLDIRKREDLHTFIKGYAFFATIFEGCFFYNGFTPLFALQRINKMKGSAEQMQYIIRDEALHSTFGMRVVKEIMKEEDISISKEDQKVMWEQSLKVEEDYAAYILPNPVAGYSKEDHLQQFKVTCNMRARFMNWEEPYPGEQPVSWVAGQIFLDKHKNGFESTVTSYQVGSNLSWDD